MSNFYKFIKDELPELVKTSINRDEYKIDVELIPFSKAAELTDEDGTVYVAVSSIVKVTSLVTGEELKFEKLLLKVPVETEVGLRIGGSLKQSVRVEKVAPGWYIAPPKKELNDNTGETSENNAVLNFHTPSYKSLKFIIDKGCVYFDSSKGRRVDLFSLLVPVMGLSADIIADKIGPFPEISSTLNKFYTNCIDGKMKENTLRDVARHLSFKIPDNASLNTIYRGIVTRFFDKNRMEISEFGENTHDLRAQFSYRVVGMELAQDVNLGSTVIKSGTTLTTDILNNIDEHGIEEILVLNREHEICKIVNYKHDKSKFTIEELLTELNMYLATVNGCGVYDNPNDTGSKMFIGYNEHIEYLIKNNINEIISHLESRIDARDLAKTYNAFINVPLLDLRQLITEQRSSDRSDIQQSDILNLASKGSKTDKIVTDFTGNVSLESKAVQAGDFSIIDPCESVEGKKIGTVYNTTILSKYKDGRLKAPYLKVEKCKIVSDEPVYLHIAEQCKAYIANWNETFKDKYVYAMHNGIRTLIDRDLVDYKLYSPIQTGSRTRNMLVFQGNLGTKRLTMGINHIKQAVDIVDGERPLVATGIESLNENGDLYKTARDILKETVDKFGFDLSKSELEELISTTTLKPVSIKETKGSRKVSFKINGPRVDIFKSDTLVLDFPYCLRSSQEGVYSYNLNKELKEYKDKDIVIYHTNTDIRPVDLFKFADYGGYTIDDETLSKCAYGTGKNLSVAIMGRSSASIDDAIVIRKGVSLDSVSVAIIEIPLAPTIRDKKDKNTIIESQVFKNWDSTDSSKYTNGIINVGEYLYPKDTVCYITKRASGKEDENLEPHKLDAYTEGEVIYTEVVESGGETVLYVSLWYVSPLIEGDKISGRHGNKGVVSRREDDSRMPYNRETGEPIDVLLNPLGVPSRMNISQFLEIALALVMKIQGKHAIVSPFHGGEVDMIKEKMQLVKDKDMVLCDGLTCKPFERDVFWGYQYILKAEHQINKKAHAINKAKVNHETGQPLKGRKNEGGQKIGEMESWSFMSANCMKVAQDLFSLQSDDTEVIKRLKNDIYKSPRDVKVRAISSSESGNANNNNESAFIIPIRAYGMNFDNNNEDYVVGPLTDKFMEDNFTKVNADFHSIYEQPIQDSKDMGIMKKDWCYVNTNHEYINPYIVFKSGIPKFILTCKITPATTSIGTLSTSAMAKLYGKTSCIVLRDNYLGKVSSEVKKYDIPFYYYSDITLAQEQGQVTLTGLEAILTIFRMSKLESTLNYYNNFINSSSDKSHKIIMCNPDYSEEKANTISNRRTLENINLVNNIKSNMERGITLQSYICKYLPLIPLMYRPKSTEKMKQNDLSWFYDRLIMSVPTTGDLAQKEIFFKTLIDFTEATPEGMNYKPSEEGRQGIASRYFGKGRDDHGQVRTGMLSKRVHFSGRSPITPEPDPFLDLEEVGIPFEFCAEIWRYHLRADLLNKDFLNKNNLVGVLKVEYIDGKIDSKVERVMDVILDSIVSDKPELIENKINLKPGQTVNSVWELFKSRFIDFMTDESIVLGRQPTLHKYGIRAFNVVPVKGKSIRLHPLVCDAYNADFDGDQMWFSALIRKQAQKEAMEKLGALSNALNPKDSSPTIKPNQDVLLGIYGLTMFKNNCTDIMEYQSIEDLVYSPSISILEAKVKLKLISPSTLSMVKVNDRFYVSTAGRILFNTIFEDGFTDKPFTNPNNIVGLGELEKIVCELKFDALIVKKFSGNSDKNAYYRTSDGKYISSKEADSTCTKHYMKYASIIKYTNSEYMNHINDFVEKEKYGKKRKVNKVSDMYTNIIKIGFEYFEFLGMTLGIDDFDKNPDVIKAKENAAKQEQKIYEYYMDGYISEESKKESIRKIYDDMNTRFEKTVNDMVERNNNMFIISDSGSKGNASQIKMIIASVGIGMKTLNEALESPIVSNFSEGLDVFDIYLASYGSRMGFISTQDGAPKAGRATRQGAYMLDGLTIVEDDCGNSEQIYKPTYDEFKSYKILSGGKVIKEVNDGDIERTLLSELLDKPYDRRKSSMKKYFSKGKMSRENFNDKHLRVVKTNNISYLEFKDFEVEIKYSLSKFDKSVMRYRFLSDNSNLYEVARDTLIETSLGHIVSEETLNKIEDLNLREVGVRTIPQCSSSHGVCKKCYGLKYDNLKEPELNEFVGFETAQAIGEPSSQITISLINSGGAAGGSIEQGVQMFNLMLNGNLASSVKRAKVSPFDGYVNITDLGNKKIISVTPDPESTNNSKLLAKHSELNIEPVEVHSSTEHYITDCVGIPGTNIYEDSSNIIVFNGQYVKEGQELTSGKIHPHTIKPSYAINYVKTENKNLEPARVYSIYDIEEVCSVVQRELAKFYYTIFVVDSGIELNARHFEVLAKAQASLVNVFYADPNSSLKSGEISQVCEVLSTHKKDNLELDTSLVCFDVSDIMTVVAKFGGPFSCIAFERNLQAISHLTTTQNFNKKPTALNSILVGEDLTNLPKGIVKRKDLRKTAHTLNHDIVVKTPKNNISKSKVFEEIVVQEQSDIFGEPGFDETEILVEDLHYVNDELEDEVIGVEEEILTSEGNSSDTSDSFKIGELRKSNFF